MAHFIHRIVAGWVVIFLGSLAQTLLLLSMDDNWILVPRSRSILMILAVGTLALLVLGRERQRTELLALGCVTGLVLPLLSIAFFQWAHPMCQYALVRSDRDVALAVSRELYYRESSIVRSIEQQGPGESEIERYVYSPRASLILGARYGEGIGSPDVRYELDGFAAWFFAVRVVSEEFAFYVINLTPFLALVALYRTARKRPAETSRLVSPMASLSLLGPLCLGLVPLVGP